MLSFIEVLNRAHTGPVMKPDQWDLMVINKVAGERVSEHGLKGVYDPETPINSDGKLADEFFQAGFEMALETGMYCLDTQRIIKYDEQELKEAVKKRVDKVTFGRPPDEVVVSSRRPEDNKTIVTAFGPLQIIDEDIYIPLHRSIAQHRVVDILATGCLDKIHGADIRADTPYETLAGKHECSLAREAVRLAGRPGMPLWGPMTSPTQHGLLGSFGIPGGFKATDIAVVLGISELKTSYTLLHKVAHLLNIGAQIRTYIGSMFGGYPGPIECVAVTAIAGAILLIPTHQSVMPSSGAIDAMNSCTTTRPVLWCNSIIEQAITKNMLKPFPNYIGPNAGPCTDMLLYECALDVLQAVASGCGWSLGTGSVVLKNHSTGLENKSTGEIAKASAGIKLSDVNDFAKKILPKYEDRVKDAPAGKSFLECYDPKKLKPSKEWIEIYKKVQKDLRDIGVPI